MLAVKTTLCMLSQTKIFACVSRLNVELNLRNTLCKHVAARYVQILYGTNTYIVCRDQPCIARHFQI